MSKLNMYFYFLIFICIYIYIYISVEFIIEDDSYEDCALVLKANTLKYKPIKI